MDLNRRKVLEMLSDGKITAEEADMLLDRLKPGEPATPGDTQPEQPEAPPKAPPTPPGFGVSVNLGGMGDMLGSLGEMIEQTTNSAIEQASEQVAEAFEASTHQSQTHRSSGGVSSGAKGGSAAAFSFSSGAGAANPGNAASCQSGGRQASSHNSGGIHLKEETRKVEVDHVLGSPLRIRSDNGGVLIDGTTGNRVHIEAVIRTHTDERLAATTLNLVRDSDGTLRVEPVWPDDLREGDEGCDFTIQVPGGNGIEVRTSNGPVTVNGQAGNAVLRTTNGNVTVKDHNGAVNATTKNGSIHTESIDGALSATTDNGSVQAHAVAGPVGIKTSNAPVNVGLTAENSGPVVIATSNAPATLSVGKAFSGAVSLKTSNGSINYGNASHVQLVSQGKKETHLQVGKGGVQSSVKTSNATIQVNF